MSGERNVRGGIVLLALGLLLGLLMSLYAFVPIVPKVPAGFRQYDDLPRRLLRLAHIAAIMLPLINVVLGGWLDRLSLSRRAKDATSRLLLWGAAGLPATLVLEALWPAVGRLHVSGPPAAAFCAGVFVAAWGCRSGLRAPLAARGEPESGRAASGEARSRAKAGGSVIVTSRSCSTAWG